MDGKTTEGVRQIYKHLAVFKDSFQKPSQIYRFLREYWKSNPLYLKRTLGYVRKHRNSNTINNTLCYFNWICADAAQTSQKTKSYGFICPWCEVDYKNLDTLMTHLVCCHPRFTFKIAHEDGQKSATIDMSLNDSYDGSYRGFKYPGHDLKGDFRFSDPKKKKRRIPTTQVIFFRPKKRSNLRHSELGLFKLGFTSRWVDDGEADVDVCSGRLYYHTSTCLPVKPNEVDCDSEADMDPEWLRERTQLMIDEFTDVNEGEKDILKLWNLHIMKNHKYKSDGMMPKACLDFVESEGPTILSKNLSKNFTLHLANLYDFGLIGSKDLLDCMRKLNNLRAQPHCQKSLNKLAS